jgi:phospholipid/cholesterol/gamma-HCH transport system ATP-binding protein
MKDSGHPFISIRRLEKSFGPKRVLRGVDLDVMAGETMVVLGGSGEGKSVLLRHINGLEHPDAGAVWVDGQNLNGLGEEALAAVRSKVAMVFQQGALFDSLSVYENIAYPLRKHGERDEDRINRRVREVLALVELSGSEPLHPAQLSGGMKKRVALARALALAPAAVLFDEPTTGLDPIVGFKILKMIRELQRRLGLTSIVVTHDLRSALYVGDRFALLGQGRIRFIGSAEEVRHSSDALLRQFVASALEGGFSQ